MAEHAQLSDSEAFDFAIALSLSENMHFHHQQIQEDRKLALLLSGSDGFADRAKHKQQQNEDEDVVYAIQLADIEEYEENQRVLREKNDRALALELKDGQDDLDQRARQEAADLALCLELQEQEQAQLQESESVRDLSFLKKSDSVAGPSSKIRQIAKACHICLENKPDTLELACGHYCCSECIHSNIDSNLRPGMLITSAPLRCAECRAWLTHASLEAYLAPYRATFDRALASARRRRIVNKEAAASSSGKIDDKNISPQDEAQIFGQMQFFQCFTCNEPYFGGMVECGDNGALVQAQERKCADCRNAGSANPTKCAKHGEEFISYKCRLCCSLATFYCGGTHHFCTPCHDKRGNYSAPPLPCTGRPNCNGLHPANGTEYSLGCTQCREEAI